MPSKTAKKAGKKAGTKAGTLVPQKHGGAIWKGTPETIVPGPGRPPEAIRAAMRELGASKGVPFLSDVLDGKISYTLVGVCSECGKESRPSEQLWMRALADKIQASVDQRLKANEQAFKYGLGTKDEINLADDPRVKHIIQRVAELVLEIAGPAVHADVAARLAAEGL